MSGPLVLQVHPAAIRAARMRQIFRLKQRIRWRRATRVYTKTFCMLDDGSDHINFFATEIAVFSRMRVQSGH